MVGVGLTGGTTVLESSAGMGVTTNEPAARGAVARGTARDEASATLMVVGESRIGRAPPELVGGMGGGVRTATGAPMAGGADAVVKREDVVEHAAGGARGGEVGSITVSAAAAARVKRGDFVRRRGENTRTAVEMEALTAVAVACLTIIDMGKAIDRGMVIEGVRVLENHGGRSGAYVARGARGERKGDAA